MVSCLLTLVRVLCLKMQGIEEGCRSNCYVLSSQGVTVLHNGQVTPENWGLCYWIAVCPWTCHSTSLGISFFIYKTRRSVNVLSKDCCSVIATYILDWRKSSWLFCFSPEMESAFYFVKLFLNMHLKINISLLWNSVACVMSTMYYSFWSCHTI